MRLHALGLILIVAALAPLVSVYGPSEPPWNWLAGFLVNLLAVAMGIAWRRDRQQRRTRNEETE